MTVQENKKNKKIKNLLGIIIIGAIGSGLWDILLKRVVFKIGELFVNAVSYFNNNYIDHLYINVGKGSNMDIFPSVLIILIIISLPAFVITGISKYFKANQNNLSETSIIKNISDYLFNSKKRAYTFVLIITLPISFIHTDLLIKNMSTIRANEYIERNLEIIRPYLADSNFIILRSKFRLIDNKQKLIETLYSIENIATKNNISLPPCNLYGIPTNK